jgi:hypothetical protein
VIFEARQIERFVRKSLERTAGNTVSEVAFSEDDCVAWAKVLVNRGGGESTEMRLSCQELVGIVAEELTLAGYQVNVEDVSLECPGSRSWDYGYIVKAHVWMTRVPFDKL